MKSQMKALVATTYGMADVLEVQQVERPVPEAHEVLVRVEVSAITQADTMMRQGTPFFARLFLGLLRPKYAIVGTCFAGEVVAIGEEVSSFKPGDHIYGEAGLKFGTNAEYVCVPAEGVVLHKPAELSFEDAAILCDGPLTAYNFLVNMGQIKAGQKVLINGASGSIGTAAVQLAKHFGAEVTGVCSSRNFELVRSLGADHLIDYTQTDFTQTGDTYDLIFDTVGKRSFPQCKPALKEHGIYLSPVLNLPLLVQMLWTSKVGNKMAKFMPTGLMPPKELKNFLQVIVPLVTSGRLKNVIDRRFQLDDGPEAHRYVDTGRKRGNAVFTMQSPH